MSKRISRDMSQLDGRAQLATISPASTLGAVLVVDEMQQGPLCSAKDVACRKSLAGNDVAINDRRPDFFFAMILDTSGVTVGMVAHVQGLYLVPLDLVSDRFRWLGVLRAEFFAGINLAFKSIYDGCGGEDDHIHLRECLASSYANMA